MNSVSPTCFYFPTTVLLVDDDRAFIENMRPLINQGVGVKLMDNPEKVLEELHNSFNEKKCRNPFLHKVDDLSDELDDSYSIINIDIEKIHHEVYNAERFSRISTLVIDYKMPKVNGLEICRRFQQYPVNKTLLTGKADNKIAVAAFNEGVIDKFIQKSSASMVKKVDHAVEDGKSDFFKKYSEPLNSALSKEKNCILNEDGFDDFFKGILLSYNIIEYYLIDKFGSFLMLDENANCYFFIVRAETELNQFYEIAVGNYADKAIVNDLKSRKKMPVFLTDEEQKLPTNQWHNYLYAMKKYNKNPFFYYAIIENMTTNYIDKSKIVSYKKSGIYA